MLKIGLPRETDVPDTSKLSPEPANIGIFAGQRALLGIHPRADEERDLVLGPPWWVLVYPWFFPSVIQIEA